MSSRVIPFPGLHPASDALPELRAAIAVFGTLGRSRASPVPPPEPTAAQASQ